MDKYVVIGNPIEQSKSPFIHHSFAQQTHQKLTYDKQFVELDGFSQFVTEFAKQGGKGCNVTVPFKEQAFALANQLSDRAKAAGAVNTLTINDDGTIVGDNTDGQGLVADLLNNNVVIDGARVLMIGAGGAARGCILPLLAQKPAQVTITNRTLSKAQTLANEFSEAGNLNACALDELSANFDIIINSTSASLSGDLPQVDECVMRAAQCCYDMVYGAGPTNFLVWADNLGVATTIDGLGMLVGQAAESFRIWRGVLPDTQALLEELRCELAKS